jgi:hypothetical protein
MLLALGLGGCGGGSSGTGAPVLGKSLVIGPLEATGQVAGAAVLEGAAVVRMNGAVSVVGALVPGMQLSVKREPQASAEIRYDADLRGPIETIQSLPDGTIIVTVMGRGASVAPALQSRLSAALRVADTIELSGVARADGVLIASFVRLASASESHLRLGHIASHPDPTKVLVGQVVVDTSSMPQPERLLLAAPNTRVLVSGRMNSRGELQAAEMEFVPLLDASSVGSLFSMTGIVQALLLDRVVLRDERVPLGVPLSALPGAALLQVGQSVLLQGQVVQGPGALPPAPSVLSVQSAPAP